MFQIVPSIDLRGGKVVRLQQGDYNRQLNYQLDPIQTAQSFEQAGAEWMHIVDLDGAKQGSVAQTELVQKVIKSCGLKVQVGGGIRSTDDIQRLLDVGATRVVVGTKAIEDWDWFKGLAHDPSFAGKLVLALDAKDGMVATRGWTQTSARSALDVAKEVRGWALGAILYTDVAKDGMLQGPNVQQTAAVAQITDVPVIASGGVGTLEHIEKLFVFSIWGVILGRSLHDGKLNLAEVVEFTRKKFTPVVR